MRRLSVIILGVLLFSACEKQKFPDEPSISYIDITPKKVNETDGDQILITIGFEDGDGDIGSTDTSYNDLFYNIVRANAFDTIIPLRLPFVSPTGSSKAISGEIELTFDSFLLVQPPFSTDTIHYEIYILDRAENQSNTIVTEDIIVCR